LNKRKITVTEKKKMITKINVKRLIILT